MTFGAPAMLLVLLVVPLALVWYGRRERERRGATRAFVARPLAASVMPQRPGWRRHAPLFFFLIALAALAIAAARPRAERSVAVGRLSIMLATDVSGSMRATDVAPNRVTAAQRAADSFVTEVPSSVRIGVMEFNQNPLLLQSPTQDRLAALGALGRLRTGGGTSIGNAVQSSLAVLGRQRVPAGHGPSAAIVLLSDGYSTTGFDAVAAARQAARLHIPIFTVSLGTPNGTIAVPVARGPHTITKRVPPDPQELGHIAGLSGGRAYTTGDARHLSQIYKQLGSQLGHVKQRREVTAGFAGAGLALLVLGSALSLAWFGRLI